MAAIRVTDRLSFTDLSGCRIDPACDIAVVHACKEPCHRRAVGYEAKSLASDHGHYLAYENDAHLYLNLIDPPVALFKLESFTRFLAFADRQLAERPLLIHCNKGESRAPSLAVLYMAKRGLLPGRDYATARAAFAARFPYNPGKGIATFLEQNWDGLG